MASSVSSVNSVNSLYGNRNVISGLASGMDTESMIENAVSGIKSKITGLSQKRTRVEWQQDAYRGIIDKIVKFSQKYASFSSSTNLLSSSFFTKAVLTTANGKNAEKVAASGKSSSEIMINEIKQLATAAKYGVGGDNLGVDSSKKPTVTGSEKLDLSEKMDVSTVSGTLTLTYGTKNVNIEMGELETYANSKELAAAITKKLDDQKITLSNGESVKASSRIQVDLNEATGEISFSDQSGAGNDVYISGVTGKLKENLGLGDLSDKDITSFKAPAELSEEVTTGEYLSGKRISINLDGKSKTFELPKYDAQANDPAGKFIDGINAELDKAFGAGKVTTKLDNNGILSFTASSEGSTLSVSSPVGEALGLGGTLGTSYVDTGKKLGELNAGLFQNSMVASKVEDESTIVKQQDGSYLSADGKKVDEKGHYLDAEGKKLYDFTINGVTVGRFNEDTALESVMNAINNNTEAGVNVTYSRTTNQFLFTSKETGAAGKVDMGAGLAHNIFGGGTKNDGQDAEFSMTVNGQVYDGITRSDNSFDVDGMNITLKGTFDATRDASNKITKDDNTVTFTTKTDTEKVMGSIKTMVEDYNALMKEIKDAYGTLPAEKSNGSRYEPLTDEDMADMSESTIKAYEEKAKQGILFADQDLSSLYNKLRSVFAASGADGVALRGIGIETSYSSKEGTTVSIDEDKLKTALENNLDGVKDIFTKSRDNGAATNGLMTGLKTTLDNYANTTAANKGILVQRAGSPLAPSSIYDNSLQKSMDGIDKEIERWTDKLSNKVDYYTSRFSQLEQLIAQMNSQSASLAGMLGTGQ